MDKNTAVKNAPGGAAKRPDNNDVRERRFSAMLIVAAVLIICAGVGIIAWTLISNIPITDPISEVWQDKAEECIILESVPQPSAGEVDMKRSTFSVMSCELYITNITVSEANSYVMDFKDSTFSLSPCTDDTVLDDEVGYVLSDPSNNIEIRCYKKANSDSDSEYLDYMRIYAVPIPSES